MGRRDILLICTTNWMCYWPIKVYRPRCDQLLVQYSCPAAQAFQEGTFEEGKFLTNYSRLQTPDIAKRKGNDQ